MKIREAKEADIPEIVSVLKASLGEEQIKLSEKVWRYKHLENPFGKSLVLLAEEDGKIIGVRAFMRWQWQRGEKVYSAFRAVDTATHPAHQGKGIFKKLTLKAVELAKTNKDQFIFNTPNDQSRPGYLKMGWKQVGKVYVGLKPGFYFLRLKKNKQTCSVTKNISQIEIENLCVYWNTKLKIESGLFTPKSQEMLQWRYEKNPLQPYEVIAEKGYYLAAYVKKRGKLKEFRISECIYNENIISTIELKRVMGRMAKQFACHFISFSPYLIDLNGKKGNLGPVLTLNALNLSDAEENQFCNVQNWNNSLGDLELF